MVFRSALPLSRDRDTDESRALGASSASLMGRDTFYLLNLLTGLEPCLGEKDVRAELRTKGKGAPKGSCCVHIPRF